MRYQKIAVCVWTIATPLILAGCGDDSPEPRKARNSAAPTAGGSTPAVPEGERLGGPTSGVSVALPAGWREVDPGTSTSPTVQTSFELTGERGELVKALLKEQKRLGVVFAIDPSVTGYAPHLKAGCDRGGLIGASLEQLKAKVKALNPGAQLTDHTVDGKPAFKATYTSKGINATKDVAEVRVPVPGDRFCFLEIEAEQGGLPASTDQTLGSIKLH